MKVKIEFTIEIDREAFCTEFHINPRERETNGTIKEYLTEDARQAVVAYTQTLGCYING